LNICGRTINKLSSPNKELEAMMKIRRQHILLGIRRELAVFVATDEKLE
jgi:hypothetical protein